jgi:hypothetical protein
MQTAQDVPSLAGNPVEQAGKEAATDFAKMLSGVVSEAYSSQDSATDAEVSTTREPFHMPLIVDAASDILKTQQHLSGKMIESAPATISSAVVEKGGHAGKNAEKSAFKGAEALATAALPQPVDAIAPFVSTVGVAEKVQPDLPVAKQEPVRTLAEKMSAAATVISELTVVESDLRGKPQQAEALNTQATIPECSLTAEYAGKPVSTKSDSSMNAPSVQTMSIQMSSGPSDAMTITVPLLATGAEAGAAQVPAEIKSGIEMRSQEHLDAPNKKTKSAILSVEASSLLRTPETPLVMGGVRIEAAPLKGSAETIAAPHARAASSDPFSIMDATPAEPAPQLLHSSRHEVEVGINDPTYGWVEVKTHKYAGEITATLAASSSEFHRDLGTQLTGLTDYLSTRDIAIHKVVMEPMNTPEFGGQHSQQPGSDREGHRSTEGVATGFVATPSQPEKVVESLQGLYRYSSQIHLLA